MDKKKLSFSVDAGDIDIKQFLKRDFLELSIKAISTANPNKNNSWFTREAMEKSMHTFANKPILGYFENDDFVSHNGTWSHDDETGMDYWNTLGRQGERILGVIRDNDPIEIIEDKQGLSWIKVSCVLWVEYNFKQVKRLLKDAKKAKQKGGLAKNVSVEVDITDWEELPNGVMKINEFNLVGITILGSRNGIKVEPGIEDAGLSVIDIMGKDVFEKQAKAVRLAYEKLDGGAEDKKEDFSTMEENQELIAEIPEEIPEEKPAIEEEHLEEPLSEEEKCACEDCAKEECLEEEKPAECPICGEQEEECVCEIEEPSEEQHEEIEEASCEEIQKEEKCEEPCENPFSEEEHEEDDVEECDDEECEICEKEEQPCERCAEWESKYAELNDKYFDLQEKCSHWEKAYNDLHDEYLECEKQLEAKEDYEALKAKVESYTHKEFLEAASKMIAAGKLTEEANKELFESCDKKEIGSLEELKVKVALKAFEATAAEESEEIPALAMPVSAPEIVVVDAKQNKKAAKKGTWDVLSDYAGK